MVEQFRRSFLTTQVFVRRAYSTLDSLAPDEYRMRSVAGSKELIEEVIPLATLLKHLEVPSRTVRCKYVGGPAAYDAELRLSGPEVDGGWLKPAYFVEVTSAVCPKDYLRREAITRYGHVFGGPEIRRLGSRARGDDEVVSRASAVHGESAVELAVTWVLDALAAKADRQYPSPCILAVNVHPERRLSLAEWSKVVDRVRPAVIRDAFDQTYLIEWTTNTVHGI